MASGKEYTINKAVTKDVNEAVRQLVFQIDLANGLKITKEEEDKPKKRISGEDQEERSQR